MNFMKKSSKTVIINFFPGNDVPSLFYLISASVIAILKHSSSIDEKQVTERYCLCEISDWFPVVSDFDQSC